MTPANLAYIVADTWDRVRTLAAYGYEPMTLGWHKGAAYVRMWSFRTGENEWRRLPSRDVPVGLEPFAKRCNPFASDVLFRRLH